MKYGKGEHSSGKLTDKLRQCRKLWWKLQAPAPGGLLVCGPEGSGKSALVALMGQILANHPVCETHVIHIDCRGIETETLSSAKEELEKQVCARSVSNSCFNAVSFGLCYSWQCFHAAR